MKQLTVVAGPNFSGRSDFMKSLLTEGTFESYRPNGVLVGEIPSNYISGLAATVEEELRLHTSSLDENYSTKINEFLSSIAFHRHFRKNPFSLSGGEQAILAILSSLLLRPRILAIDTTIEQLHEQWRTPLLLELASGWIDSTNIFLADNRFEEYGVYVNQKTSRSMIAEPDECSKILGHIICPSRLTSVINAKNLSIQNITFGYSSREKVLTDCSYEFKSGKIYRLHGINGAGKSTLAKILTGVLNPLVGSILIDGKGYNAYRYPGKVVGYSFQNPDEQLFSKSIKSEIIGDRLKDTEISPYSDSILSAFGLTHLIDKHPSEMPFVIRKRIAMAATLANDREWFILDEPTIGQDQQNVEELTKLIKLLAWNGKGVILISHSERFIRSFQDLTTISIENGHLIT